MPDRQDPPPPLPDPRDRIASAPLSSGSTRSAAAARTALLPTAISTTAVDDLREQVAHPLSPALGHGYGGLGHPSRAAHTSSTSGQRRVASLTDTTRARSGPSASPSPRSPGVRSSGYFDLPRRSAPTVSVSSGVGTKSTSANASTSVSVNGSAGGSPVAGVVTTPATAAGVLSTPKRRLSVLPSAADADLLGLHLHPPSAESSRRRRGSSPGTTASLFEDDVEQTPRRPTAASSSSVGKARRGAGTPVREQRSRGSNGGNHNKNSSGNAAHLECLSRDELALVDTPFDDMNDEEIAAFLEPYTACVSSPVHANGAGGHSSGGAAAGDDASADDENAAGTRTPPPSSAAPLFPPSPPRSGQDGEEHSRDHPLRVLSRAVRELREVISRLEDENALLRAAAMHQHALAMAGGGGTGVSSGSGSAALGTPRRACGDREYELATGSTPASGSVAALPAPVPLPSVAERERGHDMLHDSLADALSTSLTSPSRTPVPDERSYSPSKSDFARPRSPAPSITSMHSVRSARSGRVGSAGTPVSAGPNSATKAGWGIWGWGKKPSRKNSMASLTPSVASALLDAHVEEDDGEWRRGDGGSTPSFRAVFLATRIITPDPASILVEPARANVTIANLAHALVSNARDQDISVKEQPGARPRSRSRAASSASAQVAAAAAGGVPLDRQSSAGYGDQAIAATVAVGRTLFSRGKAAMAVLDGAGAEVPRRTRTPRASTAVTNNTGNPSAGGTGLGISGVGTAMPRSPVEAPARDTPPPSVELASIVPDESRPPTVLLSRQNLGSFFQSTRSNKLPTATRFESDQPPLTDRYGFIYDIQHASMLKDASRAGTPAPISLTGHIPDSLPSPVVDTLDVPGRARAASGASTTSSLLADTSAQSSSPLSPRTPDSSSPPPNGTGTHGRKRTGTLPRSLAPAPARPTAAKDELTVSVRGSSSLQTASSTTLHSASTPVSSSGTASRLTVSSLLDQLTDIHDKQQKQRTADWDAFLRKRKRPKSERRVEDVGVGGAIASVVALAGTQSKTGQEEYRHFLKLVRRGIPQTYRADVWAECSGARDLLVPGEYAEILVVHKDDQSPVMAEIEKDVGRTFPGNVFFGGDGPGVAKLRRMLVAYSWHNPAVGYCQGMNMLAATLLLTHTDEEQAFWVLHCIIERLLPADYFAPSLIGSRADQLVLADLVATHVPRVAQHLAALSVDLTSVTFGWFLSLFTDCLPVETLFRVWDVFFVEGHDVLFRVAIAILKLNENELCATESVTDLFGFISGMTARLWGADKLIALQHSYKAQVKAVDVQGLVEEHAAALQKEIDGE